MNKYVKAFVAVIIISALVGLAWYVPNHKKSEEYPNEIIAGLEHQVKEDPTNTSLLLELALEYNKLDRLDKTEEIYKKLITLKPAETVYYFNLGMSYYYQKRYEESAQYLQDGLKVNAKMYPFYVGVLDLYEKPQAREFVDINWIINRLEELDREFGGGATIVDDYVANITHQARAYMLTEQYEKALATYEKMNTLKIGNKDFIAERIETIKEIQNNN